MSQRSWLPRQWIVGCYTLCRMGERSLDRALHCDWSTFTDYYRGERSSAIERLLAERGEAAQSPPPSEARHYVNPSWLVGVFVWLERRVKGRRDEFPFPDAEIVAMVYSLRSLQEMAARPERPDQAELIQLRMRLWDAQQIIRHRCLGLRDLKRADRVEHLYYPEFLTPVPVEELIPDFYSAPHTP